VPLFDELGDFTQEPHESDILHKEEPGRRPDKSSSVTLAPCVQCGVPVITGVDERGVLITVEPQVRTYALVWLSGERLPRLKTGRGYPAHTCIP
jgi:hypothetical protein